MEFKIVTILLLSLATLGRADVESEIHDAISHLGIIFGSAANAVHDSSRAKRSRQTCLLTEVIKDVKQCPGQKEIYEILNKYALDSLDKNSESKAREALFKSCRKSECTIKCLVDTYGQCYEHNDLMFEFDPLTKMVAIRAMCDKENGYFGMLMRCSGGSTLASCLSSLKSKVMQSARAYLRSRDSHELLLSSCRAYDEHKSCVQVRPSSTCSAKEAKFLQDVIVAGASFRKCGNQTNELFAKYSGDIQCGKEPPVQVKPYDDGQTSINVDQGRRYVVHGGSLQDRSFQRYHQDISGSSKLSSWPILLVVSFLALFT